MHPSDDDQQINYRWPKYLYSKKANSKHVLSKYIRIETLLFNIVANMYRYENLKINISIPTLKINQYYTYDIPTIYS